MIESILFFSLGFLCAGFLALMVAPAMWRRAEALTRRRIEASLPLSLNEIQADKDRMRAEFAMSTRRLEMSIKSFREKAAAQLIEIGRNREELNRLAEETGQKSTAIAVLEAQESELRSELQQREDQLLELDARLAAADQQLADQAADLEKLGRMYDEASFLASSRQIELVGSEAEFERITGDVNALRLKRKEADRRLREMAAETDRTQDALRAEREKSLDLERRIERMISALSDSEEKLARREKELAQLRQQQRSEIRSDGELNSQLVDMQDHNMRLEAELADLTLQMSTLLSGSTLDDVEKMMERLNTDRERLEERVASLVSENARLKSKLAAREKHDSDDWDEQRRESALLREQISDLAAEVVHLTEMLDGPGSPITKALAAGDTHGPRGKGERRPLSLADRVRALKEAAASAR